LSGMGGLLLSDGFETDATVPGIGVVMVMLHRHDRIGDAIREGGATEGPLRCVEVEVLTVEADREDRHGIGPLSLR
jgi:hypothetical protein